MGDDRRTPASDGVPQSRAHDCAARRAPRSQAVGDVPQRGRHRRLRASPEPGQGAVVQRRRLLRRQGGRGRSRGRVAVEHRLPRRVALVRERHLHDRRRDARRGVQARADASGQPLRQGPQAREGEGRGVPGRRRARGPDRDRVGAPRRSAVRGPDQGQARQHRNAVAGRARDQRASRSLARRAPESGEGDRAEGVERGAGAIGGQAGARAHAPQDRARRRRHARQARRLRVTRSRRGRAVPRRR